MQRKHSGGVTSKRYRLKRERERARLLYRLAGRGRCFEKAAFPFAALTHLRGKSHDERETKKENNKGDDKKA